MVFSPPCLASEVRSERSQGRNDMTGPRKAYPTIGVCGLDCGLCPRYYTVGKSRCPGCCGPDFFNKHPSCSFITCGVKTRKLEVCGECPEFPCAKFRPPEKYQVLGSSSYPPNRKVLPNLYFIKAQGIARFVEQQEKRRRLLRGMLANFDDGRSRSFYCRATALLDPLGLASALSEAKRKAGRAKILPDDAKGRARVLRELLNERAGREGIELK
jgi:hypothetical protein